MGWEFVNDESVFGASEEGASIECLTQRMPCEGGHIYKMTTYKLSEFGERIVVAVNTLLVG